MSALGQERTFGQLRSMSAIPQKQTLTVRIAKSALCQKRTLARLFDYLVGAEQD